jgi:hypothetical protein
LDHAATGEDQDEAERVLSNAAEELDALEARDRERQQDQKTTDPATKRGEPGIPEPIDRPPVNALQIAGFTSLGLAGGSLGIMGAGFAIASASENDYFRGPTRADRDDALARGKTGNTLANGGITAAAILAATGTILLSVGSKKRRNATTILPSPHRRGIGVTLGGRF